jgi:GxxExxY protein
MAMMSLRETVHPKQEVRDLLNALASQTIEAAYEVANRLGAGFLEKVYEAALHRELAIRGLPSRRQVPMPVHYRGERIGEYLADIVVADRLVVELKCVEQLAPIHLAQCLNYLRASGSPLALLINFQRARVHYWRVVHDF